MASKNKQLKFQQATSVVKFLSQLLNDNGETVNMNEEYVQGIKQPFFSYINWLEYCKFGMLFSRDSKILHLDKELLANAIKGNFKGLVLDSKPNKDSRTNVILGDYGLNARLLANIRAALMNYAAKGVHQVDQFALDIPENLRDEFLRDEDDIYNVLGFSKDKGYYSIRDDLKVKLLMGKILKVYVTNKQNITTEITMYGNTISLDYSTKPIQLISSMGRTVDLPQAFGVDEAELVDFVRNCIAHDNFVYSVKEHTFTSARNIKGLKVIIPEGWLVQFANYFVTNTFIDIMGDHEQDNKLIHGNNKYVLQFYPINAPIDTLDQVYNMLRSRVRYQITLNQQNVRYEDLRKAIDDVYAKVGKDPSIKYFDSLVTTSVRKVLNKEGITDYTIERVDKPLTAEEMLFWKTYLDDARLFFMDNLGVHGDKNNFVKQFTEYGMEDRVDEQNSDFGSMQIRLMMECFKLHDPKVSDMLQQIRELRIDIPESAQVSYEKFMAYVKQHEHQAYKLYYLVNKLIKAKADELYDKFNLKQGKTQKFFDQIVYLDPVIEKQCKDYLLAEIERRKRVFDEQYADLHKKAVKAVDRVPDKLVHRYGNTKGLTEASLNAMLEYLAKNDPEGMTALKLATKIQTDYKTTKRFKKLIERYDKEKQEFYDRFYERKMQVIKGIEESRGNNIGAITGKVDTHITGDTLLQLMDNFNRLGYHADGTKAEAQMCVNKNDLETMLVNRRDVVSALSVYQTYCALVMSGFIEKGDFLLNRNAIKADFDNVAIGGCYRGDMTLRKPGKDIKPTLLEKQTIEQQVKDLDLQGIDVKGLDRNKISQMGVNGKMYILYMIRSSLVHGNVKIADFYDYSGKVEEVKLQFGNNVTCSANDLIRVFSNPVFVGGAAPASQTKKNMDTESESEPK